MKQYVNCNESIHKISERFYELGFGVESIIDNNVIDLEVTPNRGDALSVLGLAREYAASTRQKLNFAYHKVPVVDSKLFKVEINTNKVIAYSSFILENVSIIKSPSWLVNLLKQVDINSFNNIVDITNYIMHDLGQPLHAFDLDKIGSDKMIIRNARNNESITTINEKTYQLNNDDIIIEANGRVIDLVGIQGGLNSQIDASTNKILIQAIIIDPECIRKTSKKMKFSTEASYRFERNIDHNLPKIALSKAYSELKKIIEFNLIQTIYYLPKNMVKKIEVDYDYICQVLGTKISKSDIDNILVSLGFKFSEKNIYVPSWRINDISSLIDISEEVARLYGYKNLNKMSLTMSASNKLKTSNLWKAQSDLSNQLINNGYTEVQTYPFQKNKNYSDQIIILNPLSADNKYLRRNLKDGVVEAAEKNTWANHIKIFEIGNIFSRKGESINLAILSNDKIEFISDKLQSQITDKKYRRKYFYCEMNIINALNYIVINNSKSSDTRVNYSKFSKYPPVVRDIAFIVDDSISTDEISKYILSINQSILIAKLFDVYHDDKIGKDKISLAYQIVLQSTTKTMTQLEAEKLIDIIKNNLTSEYNVNFR